MGLGRGEKADYVEVKGTIMFVRKERMWYPACPEEGNNKKMVEQSDGSWFCEANNKAYNHCEYRYTLSVQASDHTGHGWMTVFNDEGLKLLGHSANDLQALKTQNEGAFDAVVNKAHFKTGLLKLRVREEVYQDNPRQKLAMSTFTPINYAAESKGLLDAIATY